MKRLAPIIVLITCLLGNVGMLWAETNHVESVTVCFLVQPVRAGQILTTNLITEFHCTQTIIGHGTTMTLSADDPAMLSKLASVLWSVTNRSEIRLSRKEVRPITKSQLNRYLGHKFIRDSPKGSNGVEYLELLTEDFFAPGLGDHLTPDDNRKLPDKPHG